jgi:fructose-1,6-bisphosphatase II
MSSQQEPIERNIAMELVRVTEAAALSAARHLGRGDKNLVDGSAVNAMRHVLGYVSMDGIVVIGEGEKDEAPMLYIGESIGDGSEPEVDIAVDPVDGTTLTAKGLPGAIAVVALSCRGTMHCPRYFVYMNKIVVGPEARGSIDINAPVRENIKNVSIALKKSIGEVTVVVLDRPRHSQLLEDILPDRDADVLMGVGGTTEGVLSAAAIQCMGGEIQCKAWPRSEEERQAGIEKGEDVEKVYKTDDLISTDDVFFAATGVSSGDLFKGVRYFSGGATTQSLAMRGRSGTVRWIDSRHNFNKLDKAAKF